MLLTILIISVIVERVLEYLLLAVGEEGVSLRIKILGSVILSLTAAIVFQLDLLYAIEIFETITWPGMILTGFVISLGSHFVHDLVGIVKGIREDKRPLQIDAGMGQSREE